MRNAHPTLTEPDSAGATEAPPPLAPASGGRYSIKRLSMSRAPATAYGAGWTR